MTNLYAPIILFVYNRLDHTRKTVESLQNNTLAKFSDLIIYCDAEKDVNQRENVQSVRKFIHKITGFKTIQIVENKENLGLAKSITLGITAVINDYGRVIVLEDDIITSPYFLQFMNDSLEAYKDNSKVWHISGWSYPIPSDALGDTYFIRIMNCWGWATWSDRWSQFNKNPKGLKESFNRKEITEFDMDNSRVFWPQVIANLKGEIDTWAIFWYATIFSKGGLCLAPTKTYTNNIGLDGSGTNCKEDNSLTDMDMNQKIKPQLPQETSESQLAYQRICTFLKNQRKPLLSRIIQRLRREIIKLKNFIEE